MGGGSAFFRSRSMRRAASGLSRAAALAGRRSARGPGVQTPRMRRRRPSRIPRKGKIPNRSRRWHERFGRRRRSSTGSTSADNATTGPPVPNTCSSTGGILGAFQRAEYPASGSSGLRNRNRITWVRREGRSPGRGADGTCREFPHACPPHIVCAGFQHSRCTPREFLTGETSRSKMVNWKRPREAALLPEYGDDGECYR